MPDTRALTLDLTTRPQGAAVPAGTTSPGTWEARGCRRGPAHRGGAGRRGPGERVWVWSSILALRPLDLCAPRGLQVCCCHAGPPHTGRGFPGRAAPGAALGRGLRLGQRARLGVLRGWPPGPLQVADGGGAWAGGQSWALTWPQAPGPSGRAAGAGWAERFLSVPGPEQGPTLACDPGQCLGVAGSPGGADAGAGGVGSGLQRAAGRPRRSPAPVRCLSVRASVGSPSGAVHERHAGGDPDGEAARRLQGPGALLLPGRASLLHPLAALAQEREGQE